MHEIAGPRHGLTGASRMLPQTAPVALTELDLLQAVVTVLIAAVVAAGGLLTARPDPLGDLTSGTDQHDHLGMSLDMN